MNNQDIKKSTVLALIVLLTILSIVNACKKEKNDKEPDTKTVDSVKTINLPIVITNEINTVTDSSAMGGGSITDDGGADISARGLCWATTPTPTVDDQKTNDGTGTSTFNSTMTGLQPNTSYYVRAYATNSKGTAYGDEKPFVTLKKTPKPVYGSITDQEGNTVKTVQIGTQTWTAENLNVTQYSDGIAIPNVTDGGTFWKLTTGAYCNYNNDAGNAATYGRLYNWYAVNTGKLCPTGWHVPSNDEWHVLENYLTDNGYSYGGSGSYIAKSMAATTGWKEGSIGIGNNPSTNNKSGFSALPVGGRVGYGNGPFGTIGDYGYWWSSTEYSSNSADNWDLRYDHDYLYNDHYGKGNGFSVRCLKD